MHQIIRTFNSLDLRISDIAFYLRIMKTKGDPCKQQRNLEEAVEAAREELEDLKRGFALFAEVHNIATDVQRQALQARIDKLDPVN